MYESLKLHNFTAFADAEFEFVDGINVYAGSNGSGKTHLLKVLYSLQKHQVLAGDPSNREALDVTLMSVFKPDALGRLIRRQQGRSECVVKAMWDKKTLEFKLATNTRTIESGRVWAKVNAPIFIPDCQPFLRISERTRIRSLPK